MGVRTPQVRIDAALVCGWFEVERGRVDTIAQTGGLWAVVKDVAQVPATAAARHLSADHKVAEITLGIDRGRIGRLPVAGPARA